MTEVKKLVERTYIDNHHKYYSLIDSLSSKSKDLYNLSCYYIKKSYKESGKLITFTNLYHLTKNSKYYRALPTKVSKQIIKRVHITWRGYTAAHKDWCKNPSKYKGEPNPPGYLRKETDRYIVVYPPDAISSIALKESIIKLSMCDVAVPTLVKNKILEVRLVPKNLHYILEVVYEKLINKIETNSNKLLAIDCGLNNLLTLATNQPDIQPIIINGRGLKSINRLYNKKLAEMKSRLPNKVYTSEAIINLTNKRNKRLESALHKASSLVIDYCKDNHISKIAIGYNPLWKQEIRLGKRNNQNFVQIPHRKLLDMIKYKGELLGIEVIIKEESYTSKCSALDLEPITKHNGYVGDRVYRGLFKTATGLLINADWNGALNIGRKVFGDEFVSYLIGTKPISPKRINPI